MRLSVQSTVRRIEGKAPDTRLRAGGLISLLAIRRSTVVGSMTNDQQPEAQSQKPEALVRYLGGSVWSAPSRGAPVPDEPRKSVRPSGNVMFRPFARRVPSLAW